MASVDNRSTGPFSGRSIATLKISGVKSSRQPTKARRFACACSVASTSRESLASTCWRRFPTFSGSSQTWANRRRHLVRAGATSSG
jgi:hypothetical protein